MLVGGVGDEEKCFDSSRVGIVVDCCLKKESGLG